MQRLPNVSDADHGDIWYNVSCVSTSEPVNLLDQEELASDIYVRDEIEAVYSSKGQLEIVLDGLGMHDGSAMDGEVDDSYSDDY